MANIGSRTFNLIGDKYLTLANEEFVRTLAIRAAGPVLDMGINLFPAAQIEIADAKISALRYQQGLLQRREQF